MSRKNFLSRVVLGMLVFGVASAESRLVAGSPFVVRGGQLGSAPPPMRPFPSVQPGPGSKSNNGFSVRSKKRSTPKASLLSSKEEDERAVREMMDSFLSRDNRNSFIVRVYSIVLVQLLVTIASCVWFGLNPDVVTAVFSESSALSILAPCALFVPTITSLVMCFWPAARRNRPWKWILLSLFTGGEALAVGLTSAMSSFRSVILALGATALAAISVSAYTIVPKDREYDLTQWGQGLLSFSTIVLAIGLLMLAIQFGWVPADMFPHTDLLYAGLAAIMASCFLAYDTKLIVGGKHSKYCFSDKDYVFGAMTIYMDIVLLFSTILRLMEKGDSDK